MTNGRKTGPAEAPQPAETRTEPISIIGMAGRFPGAQDTDELWRNLAEGVESIAILTQEEMPPPGFPRRFRSFRDT